MSGIIGGGDDAAKAQEDAARAAQAKYEQAVQAGIGFNKEQYERNRGDLERFYKEGQGYLDPYREAGQGALGDYLASMGAGEPGAQERILERFKSMPGYQFALDEGNRAIDRSAAARGRTQSGGLLKELMRYGQGYANQEFGKYQDRLGALAQMGYNAASQSSGNALNTGGAYANIGQNYAGNVSNLYGGLGESNANAELAIGNARAQSAQNKQNMWNGIVSGIGTGVGYLAGGPGGAMAGKFLAGGAM